MPHGVTALLFVLLAGLLVAVARGQSDYYDQYLDTQVRILYLVSVELDQVNSANLLFNVYDTFIERSCEQVEIAKHQQMNVEITAQI